MFRSLLFISIAVLTAAAQLSPLPDKTQPQAGSTEVPTFRSSTALVNIDVVVTDRDGKPVTDLNKNDFHVFDRGTPQKIAIFSVREFGHAENELSGRRLQPLPPGEYTNDAARLGHQENGVTIILFDTIAGGGDSQNAGYVAQAYALGKVRALLRQLQPIDHVGIYVLHQDGLKIVYPPYQPATALVEAVGRYDHKENRTEPHGAMGTSSTGSDKLDRFLRGKENRWPLKRCDPTVAALTIAAFQEIARNTEGHTGAKR